MLTSRQKLILKAIIEQYVNDAQPVGSKLLTELPHLDYSSATIRYDMAQLENLGFLEKPHTSSGRIPSQKGYKYYVNNLVTRSIDVTQDFPLIEDLILKNSYSRKNALEQAIKLLSELTKYTTLAVGSNISGIKIKKIDFIPVKDDEAVILIVTNQGHVQHQSINIPKDMKINDLKEVIKTLDEILHDRMLDEASEILKDEFAKSQISKFIDYQQKLFESFIDAFSKFAQDNFYLSGETNVFDQFEFNDSNQIKNFVNMLNKREIFKLIETNNTGLKVTFGNEIQLKTMKDFSIISIPYNISDEENGTIAVLGPTRMEYAKVIPLLEYIALNLGKLYRK